jgi:uncharacterized protein
MGARVKDFPLADEALHELPIFPLGQLVLFPNAFVPLHIFEPRYRAMIQHCMETHRAFAIAHVPDPSDLDERGNPRVSKVAGAGVILAHEPHEDGRSNVLVRGKRRVLLDELPFELPFRRARATVLPSTELEISDLDRDTLLSVSTRFVQEVRKRKPSFEFALPKEESVEVWVDLCAHYLIIRSEVKQAALEECNTHRRLDSIVQELVLQTSTLQGNKITVR